PHLHLVSTLKIQTTPLAVKPTSAAFFVSSRQKGNNRAMTIALLFFCISLCAAWVVGFAYLIISIKLLPVFRKQHAPTPDVWPCLSVVIPACNEAATLESAVATLLQQDYPDLEIILVDDRSTDGTGELIDRLARQDPRIRAVHVEILPQGWLGKVHALHRGVEQARAHWLT